MIYLATVQFETPEGRFAVSSKDGGEDWFIEYGQEHFDRLNLDLSGLNFAGAILDIYAALA